MLRLLLGSLISVGTSVSIAAPELEPRDHLIRVRVAAGLHAVALGGTNLQVQVKKNSVLPVGLVNDDHLQISRIIGEELSAPQWQVQNGRRRRAYSSQALLISGERIRWDGHEFAGQLVLWPKADTKMDVIAVLDIEEYLKRVLPGEMVPSWPMEALKAQAVAARSYALAQKRTRQPLHFDVEATIEDQVFQAVPKGYPQWAIENVDQAVESTRGQVLVDSRQEVIKTYFHADCGGATDESQDIWGDGGRMGRTKDRRCPLSPKAKWQLVLSKKELGRRLKNLVPVAEDLLDVRPLKFLTSGRVKTLWVQGTGGGGAEVTSEEFRRAVGFGEFRSTRFSISKDDKQFKFSGLGHGHGVGLCQWGSREMAKSGKSYQSILKHYFSKARLQQTTRDELTERVASHSHETN